MSVAIEWIAHPETTKYNLPVHLVFPKRITVERIRKALLHIIEVRETLRLRITQEENGEIRQYVGEVGNPNLGVDLKVMSDAEVELYVKEGFLRPFTPFSSEPLVRFEIIEAESSNHLLADFHHILADGTTLAPIWSINDLKAALEGKPLKPHDYSILQYAEKEQKSFCSELYARAKDYYKEKFAGISFTNPATLGKPAWGNQVVCSEFIDASEVEEWGRANGFASNLLFLSAFQIGLSRFCREEKVASCTLNHGRSDRLLRGIYGMFVRNTPVTAAVCPSKTVLEFVREQRRELMSTIRYGAYPITHFCRDLNKSLATVFAFQGGEMLEYLTVDGERIDAPQLPHGLTDENLACMIYTAGKDYEIRVTASDALYTEGWLRAFAKAVRVCVRSIMDNPLQTIGELQIVDEKECAELLELGNYDADCNYAHKKENLPSVEEGGTFIGLFLRQAAKTPDNIAVVDETGSYTYAELERESARYAQHYKEEAQGTFCCVPTRRTKDFLARVIGIGRAGCAYVPVDEDLPKERKRFIMDDADGKSCPPGTAYMIYTSGTSGKPKGVMISHSAKANLVRFIAKEWQLTERSRISCHSSFAFDASVEDLFPVLTVGGSVYIVPEKVRKDLHLLYDYICENGITGGCYTTQFGQLLLQHYPDLPVEYLVVGGERMTRNPDCKARLINTYGPTEFTVDATFYELEHGKHYDNIPIGRPFANTSAFILDANGNLLPRGIVGELCLSGVQMAIGYWNQQELTADKFQSIPSFCRAKGYEPLKIYRTGDLCRWNEDGLLEYVGRIDNQVKLRGYRVELAEIERISIGCEGVVQAVAAVKEVNGADRLVVYLMLSATQKNETDGGVAVLDALKSRLRELLPSYMLPDFHVVLDAFPTTSNGKIDYDLLPIPENFPPKQGAEPATEMERKLCRIFSSILGGIRFFADDDFFLCGGTSILAIRVVMEAAKDGLIFTYKDFFDNPTPQMLAAFIDGKGERKAQHDIADYDYSAIDSLLECGFAKCKARISEPFTAQSKFAESAHKCSLYKSYTNVLLFGANGFLGIHLLYELLHEYKGKIVCTTRAEDDGKAYERLAETYMDFHAERLDDYRDRVQVIALDITDKQSFQELKSLDVDTAINCAANVKHFAKAGGIMAVNYHGALNILDFCKENNCRLIHASTTSVCGRGEQTLSTKHETLNQVSDKQPTTKQPTTKQPNNQTTKEPNQLNEQSLYIGQDCSANEYVLSKFLAERAVLQAVVDGLDAKVIRLGNLSPRISDGRFQRNADDNTFMRTFKGFARAGAYPKEIIDVPIHFEPIDETARAFLLLANAPNDCVVLHCYNASTATYGDMISAMKQSGMMLKGLSLADFAKKVETLSEEDKTLMMTNIVAYGINADSLSANAMNIDSTFSNELLSSMGFEWTQTNGDYLSKCVTNIIKD